MSYAIIWYRGRAVFGITPWPPNLGTAEKFARDHLPSRVKQDRATKVDVVDVGNNNAVLVSIRRERRLAPTQPRPSSVT